MRLFDHSGFCHAPSMFSRRKWVTIFGFMLVACSKQQPVTMIAPTESDILPEIPAFEAPKFERRLAPIVAKLDPEADLWDSESISAKITDQLVLLAHELEEHRSLSTAKIGHWSTESFSGTCIPTTASVFSDGHLNVYRPNAVGSLTKSFSHLLHTLIESIKKEESLQIKFKVIRVAREDVTIKTTVDYQASTPRIQQNAQWKVVWEKVDESFKIKSLQIEDFEETHSQRTQFQDLTASLLGPNASYTKQLSLGSGYWTDRLERRYDIDSTGHQGIALGDVNGDGLEDLYVCQQGGLPNLLYAQQPDGTLRDISQQSGLDWMENTHAALFVDLDNDGDQDIALARGAYLIILKNNGSGTFTLAANARNDSSYYSIAAVDYNNDSLLDLYFCGNTPRRAAGKGEGARGGPPMPYHDAYNGGSNLLLRNDGEWKFSNVTSEAGLDENNSRFSFAASWEDYDNDGDLDLYVANDFGRNNLYRNDDGEFRDLAAEAGVEDISAGMSVTWSDYNRDGLMDLYVSNMFSSAGNRVAYQRQFREGKTETLASFQRHARGNTLFRNRGDGGFDDVSLSANVNMARWAWGAKFADINNDGWEDLYVANGYITADDTGDL
jgi:hypothetical protein